MMCGSCYDRCTVRLHSLQIQLHLPQSTGVARQRWVLRPRVRQSNRATGENWHTVAFWASLTVLGAFLYWRLFAMFAQLPATKKEGSAGLIIYHHAGEAILRGKIPYRDFFIEYPPGSLLAFVPPALFTSNRVDYTGLFAIEMALLAVAALFLTALAARRLWGPWAYVVPAVTFTAAAIMLHNLILARYDAVITLTLAISALCVALGGRYVLLAYASLGFGAVAKLVPALATLPLAALRRDAAYGYAAFFAVLALFFAPPLLLASDDFIKSFGYQAERGLQVESLAASVLMKLGWVSRTGFDYGAIEVQGRGVEVASSLSFPLSAVLLLITTLMMYREYRRGRLGVEQYPRYAAALILAYMLGSKVLSPQYMLWLLPLAPLAGRGFVRIGISAVFLAACGVTRLVLIHYRDLVYLRFPGPDLLLARNLLLVLLWVLLLFMLDRPTDQQRRSAAG
ncbi:MAG: Integral membrane protein [uncultured Chloroflexia bacterium]|uniref:Integral membrane protein n=1 Tax=uncultured Chloroflexia bacterium TaxID=1672391 RepID=A0A6J4JY82_9CHLR|nr:MAG: Integral membrane protein [uncultured Chloroflexia bacterium]